MFNVIFAIQGSNVGAAKGAAAVMTEKVESSEIISLAKGKLAAAVLGVDWEEFRRNNVTAVL